MKVRLNVNLKTASGSIISAGTVFNDPIPDYIMRRVARGQATIISNAPVASPAPVAPAKKEIPAVAPEPVPEPAPAKDVPEVQSTETTSVPEAVKKVLDKKGKSSKSKKDK